jgi:hypothetical protein
LLLTPALSILEGCNRVSDVYGLQLVQSVASRGLLWVVMAMGGGLWALPVSKGAAWLAGIGFLGKVPGPLPKHPEEWVREQAGAEDLAAQWRFAVSWLGDTCPVVYPGSFAFHGRSSRFDVGMTTSWALSLGSCAVVGTESPVWLSRRRGKNTTVRIAVPALAAHAVAMAGRSYRMVSASSSERLI